MTGLVIGIGNPLRRDDGFGAAVASAVADASLPAVEVRIVHQLTPELSELVAAFEAVAFVDASVAEPPGLVSERAAAPRTHALRSAHHLGPEALLGLGARLYGRAPRAAMFSVGVGDLDHGEGLSASVKAAVPEVADRVRAFLRGAAGSAR